MDEQKKHTAPGRFERDGISLFELMDMFPDDETAEAWFSEQRWPNKVACVECGSINVQTGAKHKTMPLRCRDCGKRFSVKLGTVMEGSNLGYRVWAFAVYMMTTRIRGVSSMELYRTLGITQKTAWFLGHRIREAWAKNEGKLFAGPVEVDETYIGGKNKNRHWDKKKPGRGTVGKDIVAGVKDRPTGQVHFEHIPSASGSVLTDLIQRTVEAGAVVYTDEWRGYSKLRRLGYKHSTVKHSAEGSSKRWVDGDAHTNGIESEWALYQRAIVGTYYGVSSRHQRRYANEFKGRRNQRPLDTIDQMSAIVKGMEGKRLRYADLVPPKELEASPVSGAVR